MKNLEQQLNELSQNLTKQLPGEVLEAFGWSIADLKNKNMEEGSIGIGEKFPDFSLPNTKNELIGLEELLQNGKVIIAFFRGSWCPYCNLELKALQGSLKQIAGRKAALVAISPQMLHYSREMKRSCHLDFELLADKDNALAKQIGISFELQPYAVAAYGSLGIDLSQYNQNDNSQLPVAAVFVIDSNRSVTYKFADANYMNRINIQELMEQL